MIPINSEMEGKIFPLHVLAELLKPQGDEIGSNLDYQHSFFDVKVFDRGGDYYLRIPFYAVAGSLDYPGVTVRVEQPYILEGYGEKENGAVVQGTVEQLPVNTATDDPDEFRAAGQSIVKRVESLLFPGR